MLKFELKLNYIFDDKSLSTKERNNKVKELCRDTSGKIPAYIYMIIDRL